MNVEVQQSLEQECRTVLARYLECPDEGRLHDAYGLARRALAEGHGVLDMADAIFRSLVALSRNDGIPALSRSSDQVGQFILECLSPFEMAHRGAREANVALRRIDEVRESEVRRVARQLHDAAGQLLATVHLELASLSETVPGDVVPRLNRIRSLLIQVERELRNLSHELRPPALDDLGLEPALWSLCDVLSRRW